MLYPALLITAIVKIAGVTLALSKRCSPKEVTPASRRSESVGAVFWPFRDVAKYRSREHKVIQRPAQFSDSTGNSVMILVYTSGALKSDYPPHNHSSKPRIELALDTKRLTILET